MPLEPNDIKDILTPGISTNPDLVSSYLQKKRPEIKISDEILSYGYNINDRSESALHIFRNGRKLPSTHKKLLDRLDASFSVNQQATFVKLAPTNQSCNEGIEESIYQLACYTFEKRKQAKERGEILPDQTLLIQASRVGVDPLLANKDSMTGHTFGIAFNTQGEILVVDGLGYSADNLAVRGFERACEQYGIHSKPPLKLTPEQGYTQIPNGCALVAATMLAAVDPGKSLSQQYDNLGQTMENCGYNSGNEMKIRQEIATVLTANSIPTPPKLSTANNNTELNFFSHQKEKFARDVQKITNHYQHPKYKISLEKVINKEGATHVNLTQERLVNTDENNTLLLRKQNVAILENDKISLSTASKPVYPDYAIILSSALKLWENEKLIINCSDSEQAFLTRLARSYHGKLVYDQAVKDIGGHAQWDALSDAQKTTTLLKTAEIISVGNFDTWFKQHIEFNIPNKENKDAPTLSISPMNR